MKPRKSRKRLFQNKRENERVMLSFGDSPTKFGQYYTSAIMKKKNCVWKRMFAAGFAAVVLASSLSCRYGTFAEVEKGKITANAETYELAETTDYSQSLLLSAPTVVAEVTDANNLSYVSADNASLAAVNAWYYLDAEGNVTGKDGTAIKTLEEALDEADGKTIPNFYTASKKQLLALSDYALSHSELTDAAVISPYASVVKTAKASMPYFRAALDFSAAESFNPAEAAREANKAGAMILVLSQKQADRETVNFLQSRMKTVWVKLESAEEFDIKAGIASGAFGLVTDGDPKSIAQTYAETDESKKMTLSRMPLNIAHRGNPYEYNENSMEGFRSACEAGATHLEVDAHLTKDGQIVIMHDESIARTTNGTGNIGSMTLEELRQYKIIRTLGGEITGVESDIPTIDELFTYCKDREVVIFFEIKSKASDFASVFKKKIEEYAMEDKIVVISFDRGQLTAVREQIPYLWACDLNYTKEEIGKTIADLCENGFGLDMSCGYVSPTLTRAMLDRGFPPAYWTYSTKTDVETAIRNGVYGITNNDAADSGAIPVKLTVGEIPVVEKSELVPDEFTLSMFAESYDGTRTETIGVVYAYRDAGDHAEVILRADTEKWSLLSDVVRVEYKSDENSESSSKSGGCGSFVTLPLVCAAVCALPVLKKKRG